MNKHFRVHGKDRAIAIGVIMFGILLTISPAFFERDIIDSQRPYVAILILLLLGGYVYALLYQTYIAIDDVNLKIVKILLSRRTVPIKSIHSILFRAKLAGFTKALSIEWVSDGGVRRSVAMPIISKSDTAAILHLLIDRNSSINMDQKTRELMDSGR